MEGARTIRMCAMAAFSAFLFAGAAASALDAEEGGPESEIEIQFDHSYDDEGKEQAVICALDENGDKLWSYSTDAYPGAQLPRVSELGIHEGIYYYCEDGILRALDAASGELIWENSEFQGSSAGWDFDEDGNLYVCGSLGPDLFAASWDGGWTILDVDSLGSDYYEPYELEVMEDNQLRLRFAEGVEYREEGYDVIVELRDVDTAFEADTESGESARPKAGLRKEVVAWHDAEKDAEGESEGTMP